MLDKRILAIITIQVRQRLKKPNAKILLSTWYHLEKEINALIKKTHNLIKTNFLHSDFCFHVLCSAVNKKAITCYIYVHTYVLKANRERKHMVLSKHLCRRLYIQLLHTTNKIFKILNKNAFYNVKHFVFNYLSIFSFSRWYAQHFFVQIFF